MAWFSSLFARPRPAGANTAYIALVAQARNPFFYTELAVPDTLDGRFEMIVLHLFLLQHRLLHSNREPSHSTHDEQAKEIQEFARGLGEVFFDDMDRSIREFGVADTGVGKRIKRMGKAYHGRLQAYTAGLADDTALQAALARNLYGTVADGDPAVLPRMATYMRSQLTYLQQADTALLLDGNYVWPDVAATLRS